MAFTQRNRDEDPVAVDHLAPEARVVDFAPDPLGAWKGACSEIEISQELMLQLRQAVGIEELRNITIDLSSASFLCFVRPTMQLLVELACR